MTHQDRWVASLLAILTSIAGYWQVEWLLWLAKAYFVIMGILFVGCLVGMQFSSAKMAIQLPPTSPAKWGLLIAAETCLGKEALLLWGVTSLAMGISASAAWGWASLVVNLGVTCVLPLHYMRIQQACNHHILYPPVLPSDPGPDPDPHPVQSPPPRT